MEQASIGSILEKYSLGSKEMLIPVLQEIQDRHGYIPEEVYQEVANHLGVAVVKVCSVASFYNEFRMEEPGRYHFQICQGMGCQLERGDELRREAVELLAIKPGEVSRDGWFSLEFVPCLGVCQVGPVLSLNGKIWPAMNRLKFRKLFNELKEGSK